MKKRQTWIFVAVVWIIYFLVNLGTKLSAGFSSLPWLLGVFVTSFSGFIVTWLLLKYYDTRRMKDMPLIEIFILVIIGSAISSIFWVILDLSLSLPIWGFRLFKGFLSEIRRIDTLVLFFLHFLIFFFISAFYWGSYLINKIIEEKVKTEKALLMAENTRLKLLGLQLNPHFLFNSLSSLRSLIREDQKRAENMLTKISEFLRYSLISKKDIVVPFSEELEAIGNYIEIERVRYGENLATIFEIDPLAEDYPVLCFLLHPVIENAVKYGMDTSPLPLEITIKAEVADGKFCVRVTNTGQWINGLEGEKRNGTGNGLMIVQERLKHLYQDDQRFEIEKGEGTVSVLIEFSNKKDKR